MTNSSKVWFITGASSGLGFALAKTVIEAGHKVVITARRTELLEELSKGHEDHVISLYLDITHQESRALAVQLALAHFGHIDVLVNVAGRGSMGALEEFSETEIRAQFDVNFFGTVELTCAVLPHLRAQKSGHIINISSIGGLAALPGIGAYCASKFALEGWSDALTTELSSLGIKVTTVEPGAFRTNFSGDINPRAVARIPDYNNVVGSMINHLKENSQKQMGDPNKAAFVIFKAVNSDNPPQRLVLGADAYELWDNTIKNRIKDINSWRDFGMDTAFDDAEIIKIGSNH